MKHPSPKIRRFLLSSLVGCALCNAASGAEPKRPNIVLIIADDMGYSDLGGFGGEAHTPHLDRMAREGLVFARGYNSGRCSPTRAALLTGHYPQRVGMGDLGGERFDIGHPVYRGTLDPNIPTVAEILGAAGYATWMAGKWHLGGQPEINQAFVDRWYPGRDLASIRERLFQALPMQRGFDRYFGLLAGEAPYFVHPPENRFYYDGNELAQIETENWYATSGTTARAVDWISKHEGGAPFFLYLAYQAPHKPLMAPEAVIAPYRERYATADIGALQRKRVAGLEAKGLVPPGMEWHSLNPQAASRMQGDPTFPDPEARMKWVDDFATYTAMIDLMDQAIGEVVAAVETRGELDNTVFLFLSDNGTFGFLGRMGNTPFAGSKAQLWEGGIRTPILVWQPARPGGGRVFNQAVSLMDLAATFLDLAGVDYPRTFRDATPPEPVGRSLLPVLEGGSIQSPAYLHWDLYGQKAVLQDGRWKLLMNPGWWHEIRNRREPVYELYDLREDPAEVNDLAAAMPDKVQELVAVHAAWEAELDVLPYAEALQRGLGRTSDVGTDTNPHPNRTEPSFSPLLEQGPDGRIALSYGTHERNTLDLWSAPGEGPHPLLIYIHGGAWSAGDKTQIDGRVNIDSWLAKGVSVASINYRYSTDGILPLPVHDAVRAVQFLKYHAQRLKLNPDRFALQGGSAGGCSALYILFHDDLADPSASDPVLRESTRVAGVFGQFPQTSIHPDTIREWIGVEAASHPMIYQAVGAASYVELTNTIDAYEALLSEFSPMNHMDADDPPLFLSYPSDMTLPAATVAAAIHHGMFGVKLKEQAGRIGYTKLWLSIPGTEDAAISSTTFLETILLGK
jgi:arylsulfatase A-like enzyme/acetyl esterase/lipase